MPSVLVISNDKKVLFGLKRRGRREDAILPILMLRLDRLLDALDGAAEVIFVDDGRDATGLLAAARAKDDPRYRYLALSRNFGHQVAMRLL